LCRETIAGVCRHTKSITTRSIIPRRIVLLPGIEYCSISLNHPPSIDACSSHTTLLCATPPCHSNTSPPSPSFEVHDFVHTAYRQCCNVRRSNLLSTPPHQSSPCIANQWRRAAWRGQTPTQPQMVGRGGGKGGKDGRTRTGGRAGGRTDGRTDGRTAHSTSQARSERTNEQENQPTNQPPNERTNERANERTNERTNDQTNEARRRLVGVSGRGRWSVVGGGWGLTDRPTD